MGTVGGGLGLGELGGLGVGDCVHTHSSYVISNQGGGDIILRCSVHVRNHFRPTKLIIACFDRGSCIDHI